MRDTNPSPATHRGAGHTPSRLWRLLTLVIIGITVPVSDFDAQRVCNRGKPCGNTCIAVNRTCRVGPAKADSAASRPVDSVVSKAVPLLNRTPADSVALPLRGAPASDTITADSGAPTATLAKGGQTKVWANTKSRVYHCPGSRYYGTSSAGEWMTEAAAIKAGYRGAYNKRCGG